MPKRVSSKLSSYIKPSQSPTPNYERSQPADETVIADMAKGFLQAQANMDKRPQTNNSQEIVDLLGKINKQLEGLQNSATTVNKTGEQSSGQAPQQSGQNQQSQQPQAQEGQQAAGSPAEAEVSQELKNLFSSLLQNGSQQNNSSNASQGQTSNKQSQAQSQNQDDGQQSRNNPIAVQTAAQVLAQAQYELSNELETSLKKLKQVISESEKIASKISNLLGEKNSPK